MRLSRHWPRSVGEFTHAGCEVDRGAAVGDFDLAPRPVHVEEDEPVVERSSRFKLLRGRQP
jgi:hypothetical protein